MILPSLTALGALVQSMSPDAAETLARRELMKELGAPAAQAEVRSLTEIAWPSEALGCPEAGESYEARDVPGFRVTLLLDGALYRVHLGDDRALVCTDDEALAPLVSEARRDLAGRLAIDADDIVLVEAKSVLWPTPSLGCPQPGLVYPQVLVDGARILLRAAEKTYHYHAGGSRGPFLCNDP